jgi:hypothetical protein
MKSLLFAPLVVGCLLLAACAGAPVPAAEPTEAQLPATEAAPTPTVVPPTDTPVPTDTPQPTDTPVPTDTPTPTDTTTPVPTETPRPRPTATPEPTLTPTPQPMPPLTLLAPPEGATYASASSRPTFSWSEAPRSLADGEYYVLIIGHRDGKDFIWTKATTYTAGDDKVWWIEFGPELRWQVVTAIRRTGKPFEDPSGAETGSYSLSSRVFWYQ